MRIDFRIILAVIVGTVIFYSIMIIIADVPKIQEHLKDFKIEYLPLILGLVFSAWMLVFLRWHVLVSNLGYDVPLKSNLTIFFSSMALGMTPGRVGDLFKAQMLKSRHNIPRTKTAPLVIIERYNDLVAAVLVSSIGILYFQPAAYIMGVISIFVLIGFIIASSKKLFTKLFSELSKIRFASKFVEPMSDSFDVLHSSTRGRVGILSIILSCGHWFLVSLAVYLILLAYDIDSVSIFEIIPIYLSSVVLGAVSMIPGGIGVAEGSLAGFLNLLVDDISITVPLSIIIRILTLWTSVIVGFIFLKTVRDVFFKKQN